MENTTIIRLFDNEKIEYPLIEIKQGFFSLFKNRLKAYQENEEYNIDDFIKKIKKESWFIRSITFDKEVYF